jgi:hypothetical protein
MVSSPEQRFSSFIKKREVRAAARKSARTATVEAYQICANFCEKGQSAAAVRTTVAKALRAWKTAGHRLHFTSIRPSSGRWHR